MTSSTGHTPGPWKVREFADLFEVRSDDGIRVVKTSWHDRIRDPYPLKDEARANARLIATAPALLALLQELIDIEGPCPGTAEWAGKVRAAIAAAKGGAS